MSSYKSETQFFHDESVHGWIAQLGSAKSIVIFAGAGVTIDKTGLGWSQLIRNAMASNPDLANRGLIDEVGAEIVTRYLQPVESATIAEHYYCDLYESRQAGRDALLSKIQGLLYPGSYWRAGTLTQNLVRLAVALCSIDKDVTIATTNYETHFENQYLTHYVESGRADAKFPGLTIEVLGRSGKHKLGPVQPQRSIKLVYLHGRIPQKGGIEGSVALSEHDYYKLRKPVTNRMAKLFRGSTLIIVGSSLTDPPLLAALEQTMSSSSKRVALTPMTGYKFDALSDLQIGVLKSHLRARMKEFGVDILFPDFLFQLSQFFEELITSCTLGDVEPYDATSSSIRYGARLIDWWTEWNATHASSTDAGPLVHTTILQWLSTVAVTLPPRRDVANSKDEPLRLEVWVRWDPSEVNRSLARWASTEGINRDVRTPRLVDLSNASSYESVKAFVSGRAILSTPTAIQSDSAWKSARSFLAVPINYPHGLGPIPVGVVTLSSPWPRDETRINLPGAADFVKLIEGLQSVGRSLLGVK